MVDVAVKKKKYMLLCMDATYIKRKEKCRQDNGRQTDQQKVRQKHIESTDIDRQT